MNIVLPEEKNFKITNNYYQAIKQISEEYKIYISNFKLLSIDYIKKLKQNNEKFNSGNLETKYEELYKHVNLKHIISITSIIPSVIEQQITNLDFFIKAVDEKLEAFDKVFKEKSTQYLEQYNSYKDVKNELSKNYREIEHLKINYITNVSMIEEMVHKYYMKKNSMKKRLNSISFSSSNDRKKEVSKDPNNISTEEQVNNNIQKVKKIEEEYKNNIAIIKSIEEKYVKISTESKEKIRKILCELLNGYKEFIFSCMLFLTNCYKVPLSEIDTYMRDMVQINILLNFSKRLIVMLTKNI